MGDLTKNFSLAEFLVSETADAHGIANAPAAAHLKRLRDVTAPSLQIVRDLVGASVTITSAYRNPQVNALVSKNPKSDHPQAWAVDCNAAGMSLLGFARFIRDRMGEGQPLHGMIDQLIYEKGRTVHISFAPGRRGHILSQPGPPGSQVFAGINP